ncbi:MAG: anti-sigma factor domain-containing protein [Paraclostridium sp.]
MYFKGVVMEIKNDYAIVMKDDSTIVRVKNKKGLKSGDVIIFLEDDIYESKSFKNNKFNKIAAPFMAVAAVLMVLVIPMVSKNKDIAYALMSLDVNPSIQMELDKDKKIVSIEGMNDDGRKLNLGTLKGMDLESGLNQIKIILENQKYSINNDSAIVGFTFLESDKDINYEEDVKNIVKNSLDKTNTAYLSATKQDLEKANEKGISLGRYAAALNMKEDPEDEIENLSVEQILELLKNKDNIYLNKEVKEELQDELEDRIEDYTDNEDDDDDSYDDDSLKQNIQNNKGSKSKVNTDDDNDDDDDDNDNDDNDNDNDDDDRDDD